MGPAPEPRAPPSGRPQGYAGRMQDLSRRGYVVLTEAPDIMRAHWIAGAIEAAGIPVHVEEDNLADEFAMSQKLMGALRVRVLVPQDRRDEANLVFLDLSQPIPDDPAFHDEEDDAALEAMDDERFRFTAGVGLVLLLLMAGVPFLIWMLIQALT